MLSKGTWRHVIYACIKHFPCYPSWSKVLFYNQGRNALHSIFNGKFPIWNWKHSIKGFERGCCLKHSLQPAVSTSIYCMLCFCFLELITLIWDNQQNYATACMFKQHVTNLFNLIQWVCWSMYRMLSIPIIFFKSNRSFKNVVRTFWELQNVFFWVLTSVKLTIKWNKMTPFRPKL